MSASVLPPHELVERALAVAASANPGGAAVAIAEATSSANLRWANNTLTTNGVMSGQSLTVIATDPRADGVAAGVVSRRGDRPGRRRERSRRARASCSNRPDVSPGLSRPEDREPQGGTVERHRHRELRGVVARPGSVVGRVRWRLLRPVPRQYGPPGLLGHRVTLTVGARGGPDRPARRRPAHAVPRRTDHAPTRSARAPGRAPPRPG